jgi:hypothetical protein
MVDHKDTQRQLSPTRHKSGESDSNRRANAQSSIPAVKFVLSRVVWLKNRHSARRLGRRVLRITVRNGTGNSENLEPRGSLVAGQDLNLLAVAAIRASLAAVRF